MASRCLQSLCCTKPHHAFGSVLPKIYSLKFRARSSIRGQLTEYTHELYANSMFYLVILQRLLLFSWFQANYPNIAFLSGKHSLAPASAHLCRERSCSHGACKSVYTCFPRTKWLSVPFPCPEAQSGSKSTTATVPVGSRVNSAACLACIASPTSVSKEGL